MAATRAGMPNLSRRKSTSRSIRLAPPPRWRTVMRPYTLRPFVHRLGDSRLFSGSVFVISSYVTYAELHRVALFLLAHGLLGHHRANEHLARIPHGSATPQRARRTRLA